MRTNERDDERFFRKTVVSEMYTALEQITLTRGKHALGVKLAVKAHNRSKLDAGEVTITTTSKYEQNT